MSTGPDLLKNVRGGWIAVAVVGMLVLVALLGRAFTSLYVEVLWQTEAGYAEVLWRRLAWEWGVRLVAGLFVAVVVYFNLKIASTTLGGIQIRRRFGNLEISEQIPKRYVTLALLGTSALLGLWFGATVSGTAGRTALLAFSAAPWGVSDPILGQDLGFYVFWWPVLARVVTYGLIVAFLVFTLVAGGYSATGAIAWARGKLQAQDVARIHLGAILAVFFLLLGVRLWLGRYELLLDGNSEVQGIFGFADHQARLPALQTLTVLCVGAAAATLWGAFKNRAWPVIAALAAVVLGSVVIGNLYPSLIQSFRVEPNELVRETPYIEHSLEFTRRGFGISDVDCPSPDEAGDEPTGTRPPCMERRAFDYDNAQRVDWAAAAEQLAGLPVWGSRALLTAYQELEALYPYYDFARVAIDRYPSEDGSMIPVAISAREVDPAGIQEPNWQNLHIRELYVAGVGAVASLAATRSAETRPELLLRSIPPEVQPGPVPVEELRLVRPEVFFGTRPQIEYAVATAGTEEFAGPDGSMGVPGVDFPEGIPLASGLRKLVLAWHFGDWNLIFSDELTEDSRLIYRRQVVQRAQAIAPFLRFPEEPYPVVSDGSVVWILEGFTTTLAYPLSASYEFGQIRRMASYVRNSFKVTVDAVTGDVAFYRVPVGDPLADAFESAYPGLVRPMQEMPGELRSHLRYPRNLLDLQSRVLLQYHQETAPAFHGQQDVWMIPQELAVNMSQVPYEAEYGVYSLPGEEPRFQLTSVFVPAGRENLTAMIVARTDSRGVPEVILMDIPVEDQVSGPGQVETYVEQDPAISEQFSLWRTGGSQVWTGHLHLVPVGSRLVYMEPVFLAAEADAIPELRRFIVSDGRRIVMTESLAGSVARLSGDEPPERAVATEGEEPGETAERPVPSGTTGPWPAEALSLLERAEERARQGDWQGYGEALEELRALLERLQGAGG
ncbi:MAG: UPF0182 family protein [Longimicrobiales bacterium]|nr:UPF0182 family protein [Longimicrobiales bacterium]